MSLSSKLQFRVENYTGIENYLKVKQTNKQKVLVVKQLHSNVRNTHTHVCRKTGESPDLRESRLNVESKFYGTNK